MIAKGDDQPDRKENYRRSKGWFRLCDTVYVYGEIQLLSPADLRLPDPSSMMEISPVH